jgi:hypothetical protein
VRPVDAWIAAQMLNGVINSAAELKLWVPGIATETAIESDLQPLFAGFLQAA